MSVPEETIMECVRIIDGADSRPIFTDALNHTGLAVISYVNGTEQQVNTMPLLFLSI